MTDYLTELNRIMDHLATMPDVVATALTGNVDEFLILSDERTRYTERDDWAALFRISLEPPRSRGTLIERRAMLAGAPVTFLFGGPKWAGRRCPIQLASSDRELSVFKVCSMNSAGVKPSSWV